MMTYELSVIMYEHDLHIYMTLVLLDDAVLMSFKVLTLLHLYSLKKKQLFLKSGFFPKCLQ